jgi:hypothetical protein
MTLKHLTSSRSLLQAAVPPDVPRKTIKTHEEQVDKLIFGVSQLWTGKRQWRETNIDSDHHGQVDVNQ